MYPKYYPTDFKLFVRKKNILEINNSKTNLMTLKDMVNIEEFISEGVFIDNGITIRGHSN